jgi:hypothetical protein
VSVSPIHRGTVLSESRLTMYLRAEPSTNQSTSPHNLCMKIFPLIYEIFSAAGKREVIWYCGALSRLTFHPIFHAKLTSYSKGKSSRRTRGSLFRVPFSMWSTQNEHIVASVCLARICIGSSFISKQPHHKHTSVPRIPLSRRHPSFHYCQN